MRTKTLSIGMTSIVATLLGSACDTTRPWAPYPGHVVLEKPKPIECPSIAGGELDVCVVTTAVHYITHVPVPEQRVAWRPLGGVLIKELESVTDGQGMARARLERSASGETGVEVRLTDRPGYSVTLNLSTRQP